MTNLYSDAVAAHYSSYRPPLHRVILERVLNEKDFFSNGADIGCGTGCSTTALTVYCEHVYGIDPNQPMLKRAKEHPKITYLSGAGGNVPLPDSSVDVVTFAGALFYMKDDATFAELKRICRKGTFIIPYDFEIVLAPVLQKLCIDSKESDPDYDHSVNLSHVPGFTELGADTGQIGLEVTPIELAHILLSDLSRYEAFSKKYNLTDPFPALKSELIPTDKFVVKANLYYSKYRING